MARPLDPSPIVPPSLSVLDQQLIPAAMPKEVEEESGASSPQTSFCFLEEREDERSHDGSVFAQASASSQQLNHQLSANQKTVRDGSARGFLFGALARHHESHENSDLDVEPPMSLQELFPVNASVFTNPQNIMPSVHDAIVIDDLAAEAPPGEFVSVVPGTGSLRRDMLVRQQSLGFDQSIAEVSESFYPGSANGDTLARSMTESMRNSGLFTGSTTGTTARRSCTCKWTPRAWIVSFWTRGTDSWDSYFLMLTLVLSLIGILLAFVIAAILSGTDGYSYRTRCVVRVKDTEPTIASTASIASVLLPMVNHAVLLVVSLWIGILCSRSRKRVLRAAPTSTTSNLTSAFMLPCYEVIWYTIALLAFIGIVLYAVSYAPTHNGSNYVQSPENAKYPCEVTTLPFVWILQLLPMLMVQRSVSIEAAVRSIVYSGCVCAVMLLCLMLLYTHGVTAIGSINISVHVVLLGFYFWAKFVFHARSTFDFFFLVAVFSDALDVVVELMALDHDKDHSNAPWIGRCIVGVSHALVTVAILLALRADTRYWLGIDDGNKGTVSSRNPIRQYMKQLSERGMITNFSTRTSVYDVHRMIEEHRKNVVDFSALSLDCIIAQGATSIVMRGVMRGELAVAVKIYTSVQVTNEEVARFSRETALNVQLSHPNIVRFYGLCVVPPSISLVFEFCEYGGLDVALENSNTNPKGRWELSTKLKAWLDACRAVAYLHSFSPPLLHRDIKTDNFLLGQDYVLKLADFGEANLLRPRSDGTMTIAGTVDFMAPEMILGGKTARYGTAVDVYSLMITLWQIMVPSRNPWEGKTHLEVYTCVTNGERPPLLPSIPRGCADILIMGWAANPADRVAVVDLIPKVHKLWLLSLHQKQLKRTKYS